MRQEPSSFLGSIPRRRVVRVIIAVVSAICIVWVALAYVTFVTLAAENGDSRPLVTLALVCASLLVAALIAWRCGVALIWILGAAGLASLIQLLILFL